MYFYNKMPPSLSKFCFADLDTPFLNHKKLAKEKSSIAIKDLTSVANLDTPWLTIENHAQV